MAYELNVMVAGFGGQGILFAGRVITYAGLLDGREVSWLPSYGPEMRGGTANCCVVISDEPIGSPLVTEPDVLIVMNQPSYERYIEDVVPGGIVILDSSLISGYTPRAGIQYYPIPATTLANENGLRTLGNVIMVGKMLAVTSFTSEEVLNSAIDSSVSARHVDLIEYNKQALKLGANWQPA
ncbi:MAG: 2-oxoacid:acceptor oxidoreductase family protein [Coriobacteriia bacterium]|nr:2-oxoacid:acceptor oxidoreductase family protein [Coriobacteriia bacterium]